LCPVHDSPSLANQSRFTVRSFFIKNVLQKILLRIFRVVLLFNLHSVFIVLGSFSRFSALCRCCLSLAPQQIILYHIFIPMSTTFLFFQNILIKVS
jgi:hypothetical protein